MITSNRNEIIGFILSNKKNAMSEAKKELEQALIQEALILCRGNQTKVAEMLGMNRGTLVKRLKAMGAMK